ncbi:MAG: LysR substrate-binding domain-containing protein [Sneathiella sp.]|uniref:LysR substrate-binding domain-containing protein n=1 Tax=Sneathiella sp. TaxID=1964365 RepID=UPI003001C0D3
MPIAFKHHDTLRLFVEISRYSSFSEAADALHMTKGAISYQIKTLETDLDLKLFERNSRGVALTFEGQQLLTASYSHYRDIEAELTALRGPTTQLLTVGMSSYFASRWLSPRLMTFMQIHPEIQLRIQPMTQLFDLDRQGVDLAIRWGNGVWDDVEITPFMPMPAWPVGNLDAAEKVRQIGPERAFSEFTLLRDHDDSNAWSDWLDAAGLSHQNRKDTLIIPDPNVRVQAVIDGQGIALNDDLVTREQESGQLVRLSDIELVSYGYFLARPRITSHPESVNAFIRWVQRQ